MTEPGNWSRRAALKAAGGAAALGLPRLATAADTIHSRRIPGSDEALPVIGLGTSGVFDTRPGEAAFAPRRAILRLMRDYGATVIDSSPMYGRAESVVGTLLAELGQTDSMFLATKVWTEGRQAGLGQMRESAALLKSEVIDLMQVHNLVDLDTQFRSVRGLIDEGRLRYSGLTHYRVDAFDRLEAAMRRLKPDFVQLNYSIRTRDAERRLLPLAADLGIAVIVNRAYEDGRLFGLTKGRALPRWAAEFGIESWAQYFLKFVLSHPAVTVVIPGTSKPQHMEDNLRAGLGELPGEAARERMAAHLSGL